MSRRLCWSASAAVGLATVLWLAARVPNETNSSNAEIHFEISRGPQVSDTTELRGTTKSTPQALKDLPAPERTSLGAAMHEARYAVWQSDGNAPAGKVAAGEVLHADNPAQQYRTEFEADGVRVSSTARDKAGEPSWTLALRLESYGSARQAMPPAAQRVAFGRRVEYQREDVTEWYENTDDGLEQGFTIARPPVGIEHEDQLEVRVAVESNLTPRVDNPTGSRIGFYSSPGVRVATYGKLKVTDADGKELPARMELAQAHQVASRNSQASIIISVDTTGAQYPITIDPLIGHETKVTAADGEVGDGLGWSVAIDGDTAVVGATGANVGANGNQGAAYVFVRAGTSWSEQAKLTAADGAAGDRFGEAVAIDGDTAVVSAMYADVGANTDQGAAYVFTRSGTIWSQQAKLTAGDGASLDWFGFSVSISGETIVVGAPRADVGGNLTQGAAYVFTRSGTIWSQQAKLTAGDGAAGDWFGFSVSVGGDTALVGARAADVGANTDQGAAYVFTRSGAIWSQQAKLTADDGAANDRFGNSVSVSGDTAVVGAAGADVGANTDQGAAYVFTRSGAVWSQQAKLTADDGAANDDFGTGVAVDGDTVVVGAYWADVGASANQGAAYVFTRSGTSWNQQAKLTAGDGAANDYFGLFVSISGDTAIVGAYLADVGANANQGAAYFYIIGAVGPLIGHETKVTAADGLGLDLFGYSVTVSGDTAVVGAYLADVSANSNQGAAYVFVRSGTTWSEQAKLTAADGAADDRFGWSVSVSGETAVVGAVWVDIGASGDQGATYVFTRSGTIWSQQAKLVAGDGAAGDIFGWSVSLSGETAVVGASADVGANLSQGAAYVFTRSGTIWSEQAKLTAGDGAANDSFGYSVALADETAVVGAYKADVGANADQGAAYVFTRSGTIWSQQDKLTAADGAASDWFGFGVSADSDTAVVGAVNAVAVGSGAAYVFTRSGTIWSQQAKLFAGDGVLGDGFGTSVALDGNTAVVGARGAEVGGNLGQGAAYVFMRAGTSWSQQAKLTAADGAASDNFGESVSISGDTAVVGASRADVGANVDQGAAYVFIRSGLSWSHQAKLTAADGAANDLFGRWVAVSGDTTVVGAYLADVGGNLVQGAAYVFTRSGTSWSQQAKLTASDGAANDQFGIGVSVDGDTAVVGAFYSDVGANTNQGAAYVFVRSGTNWSEQAKLTAGDGAANDNFGVSVSVGSETAVVGAYHAGVGGNADQGAAYVFIRSGTVWSQQDKLTAADGAVNDQFGFGVSLSVETAVVGAYLANVGANADQGAAYVFTRSGTIWSQQAKLTAGDGAANDEFGSWGSVSVSGDTAVVGAWAADVGVNANQGAAYVFTRSGAIWSEKAKLTADDGAANDNFGGSVALSGDTAIVGAMYADVGANVDQGKAYFFYPLSGVNPPVIAVTPTTLSFTAPLGGPNPPSQSASITNTGDAGSTLRWVAMPDKPWVQVAPFGGTTTTETDTLSVSAIVTQAESWGTTTSTVGAPTARRDFAAVWTGAEMIVWGGSDAAGDPLNTGGRYDPATDIWTGNTPISGAPSARLAHGMVWTGQEMIVWGGSNGSSALNTGTRYDPVLDSWTGSTSIIGAPQARHSFAAVATDSEMIVWGGWTGGAGVRLNTGGRYDPKTDTWIGATSTTGAPSPRDFVSGAWTGQYVVIIGGTVSAILPSGTKTGGLYDPTADAWLPTNTTGAPEIKYHSTVWTGAEIIVWGGSDTNNVLIGGGYRYDPATNTWLGTVTTVGGPLPRAQGSGIWTGTEMIVWGGIESGGRVNTGGRYVPRISLPAGTYNSTITLIDPRASNSPQTVEVTLNVLQPAIVATPTTLSFTAPLGGPNPPSQSASITNTGDAGSTLRWVAMPDKPWLQVAPFGDTTMTEMDTMSVSAIVTQAEAWVGPTSLVSAPSVRHNHSAVWTGAEMIVWGGGDVVGGGFMNTGGRYDPATDTWLGSTSTVGAPSIRFGHSSVWTGSEMIVWGGWDGTYLNSGGRYDPITDSWGSAVATGSGIISARRHHTAIWIGTKMVVWGGDDGIPTNTGAIYNPATDTWESGTSTTSAPTARWVHSGVWTGAEMIVWGGRVGAGNTNTGGRYDPGTDIWIGTTSVAGAVPSARSGHAAVWSGREMIVWGADSNTGAIYDPALDTWVGPTSTAAGVPSARETLSAVWTGQEMIVWGGNGAGFLNDGARYVPAISLAAGTYNSTVTLIDPRASNSPQTVSVTLDVTTNSPPQILSGPSASPNPATTSTLLSVVASDPDGDPLTYTWSLVSGPGGVPFTPNGTGTSDTSTATFSSDGTYTIRVTVSDGALTTTGDVIVVVDMTAPAAPAITSPATGTVVNTETPTLSGTAEATSTVEVFIDGVSNGTTTADGTGNWSYTTTTLAEGTYANTATAMDVAGNTSVASSPAVSVTVDLTAPSVIGTVPADTATGVATSTTVQVTFAEPMDQTATQTAFSISPVVAGYFFSWSGDVLTITPSVALAEQTIYTVNIGAGATDIAGNALATPYSFLFTTGSGGSNTPQSSGVYGGGCGGCAAAASSPATGAFAWLGFAGQIMPLLLFLAIALLRSRNARQDQLRQP